MSAKIIQTARSIWVLACGELFKDRQIHASAALSEAEDTIPRFFFFFFFFHWHYSPLWALACRTRSFHFFPIYHQLSP
jgi:hypothetical protein